MLQVAQGKRESVSIFGTDYDTPDGTCIRDYIHVVDLAGAHSAALAHLRQGGDIQTFNCGYGHGYSVLEVVEAVKRASGSDLAVRLGARRAGDPAAIVADSSRIRALLGWAPRFGMAWDIAGDGKTIHVSCSYQLIVDNLMDLTHEQFVHGSSIGHESLSGCGARRLRDHNWINGQRRERLPEDWPWRLRLVVTA